MVLFFKQYKLLTIIQTDTDTAVQTVAVRARHPQKPMLVTRCFLVLYVGPLQISITLKTSTFHSFRQREMDKQSVVPNAGRALLYKK